MRALGYERLPQGNASEEASVGMVLYIPRKGSSDGRPVVAGVRGLADEFGIDQGTPGCSNVRVLPGHRCVFRVY